MDPKKISKLSINCYNTLNKTGKCTDDEWTVLSTIVQSDSSNNYTVVALGTGTKCIGASQMSNDGIILNDSHAEVICRRGFMLYLYRQMSESFENRPSIIEQINGKFQLCKDIYFHMFSTLMPCGDASIFSKENENEDYGDPVCDHEDERITKRCKIDTHRTGAKCLANDSKVDAKLPGIDYHILGAVRTKPGRGDPTLSASCSDKLAKWIHVGIQGNLISLLLTRPIYLTSITIGNDIYDKDALERALYLRFSNRTCTFISQKYYMVMPILFNCTAYKFVSQRVGNKQPCPSGIIYIKDEKVEVTVDGYKQGVTKKLRETRKGCVNICRVELFKRFQEIVSKLDIKFDASCTYGALKSTSDYSKVWNKLKEDKFQIWPVKNQNLQEFTIE